MARVWRGQPTELATVVNVRMRARVLFVAGCLATGSAGVSCGEPVPTKHEMPPLVPAADEVLVPGQYFVTKQCVAEVKKMMARLSDRLGHPLLTHSARWGIVWRSDFDDPGVHVDGLVDRAVCWSPTHGAWSIGIAIGQRIPRLP